MNLGSKMTVTELITQFPSSIAVFMKRKMLCVGCPASKFHTIEEAARIHGISLEHFLNDLEKAIGPKMS
jgi:hybrid cluster-associated redox disulfide protein